MIPMANEEHLELLKQGTTKWNTWRSVSNCLVPNLNRADLFGIDLRGANLNNASCISANFISANLQVANCQGADLSGANLQSAILIGTNLEQATLTGCFVYGISTWALKGIPKDQSNLVITPEDAPMVTVEDLEVAQFIYLLLNRAKLRNVLNAI